MKDRSYIKNGLVRSQLISPFSTRTSTKVPFYGIRAVPHLHPIQKSSLRGPKLIIPRKGFSSTETFIVHVHLRDQGPQLALIAEAGLIFQY